MILEQKKDGIGNTGEIQGRLQFSSQYSTYVHFLHADNCTVIMSNANMRESWVRDV